MPTGQSLATSRASARRPKSSTGAKRCGVGASRLEAEERRSFAAVGHPRRGCEERGRLPEVHPREQTELLLPRASKRLRNARTPELPNPGAAKPRLLRGAPTDAVPRAPGPCGVPVPRCPRCRGGPAAPCASCGSCTGPSCCSRLLGGLSPLSPLSLSGGLSSAAGSGGAGGAREPSSALGSGGASPPPPPGLLLIPERRARKEPRDAAPELPGHVPGVLASRGRAERGSGGARGGSGPPCAVGRPGHLPAARLSRVCAGCGGPGFYTGEV